MFHPAHILGVLGTAYGMLQVIKQYYWRRFKRIAPGYYTMVVLHSGLKLWEGSGRRNANAEANELAINLYKDPHNIWSVPDGMGRPLKASHSQRLASK